MEATYWRAQLTGGVKMNGGGYSATKDVNVSVVPIENLVVFTIAHNTFAHTFYVPDGIWYNSGARWEDYPYPMQYELKDGSTLTVDFEDGHLILFQV